MKVKIFTKSFYHHNKLNILKKETPINRFTAFITV